MNLSRAHRRFLLYVQGARSLFDATDASARFAVVVVGQPTELFPHGFVVVNERCTSVLAGAGQLEDWLADPAWRLEFAPGFVGPALFLAVVERLDDLHLNAVSCLLGTVVESSVIRDGYRLSVDTMPVTSHWFDTPTMAAVPSVLRLLQRGIDFNFDDNVAAAIEDMTWEGE